MKFGHLLLPALARAQDDTSTLLSLKVHTALEAGVDHLLDAVGSRNVTQMSSLLQNLVEESISDGLAELDGDVQSALQLIKDELLLDIRNSLREAHCYDQASLHERILQFETCETKRTAAMKTCGEPADGCEHTQCRMDLFELYRGHIKACSSLDAFNIQTSDQLCTDCEQKCCLVPESTWNCQLCKSKIHPRQVDASLGHWLQQQLQLFRSAHAEWENLYKDCKDSYRAYVEKDAKCDCMQAEDEARNCEYEHCGHDVCEKGYHACWGAAEEAMCKRVPIVECLERDRKIDWSATEKIECYVDVLLHSPTEKELKDQCGEVPPGDCINKWREEKYLACNDVCKDPSQENIFPGWGSMAYGECSAEGNFVGSDNECIDKITKLIKGFGDHKRRYNAVTQYKDGGHQGDHQTTFGDDLKDDQDLASEGELDVRTHHRREGGEPERCTAHLDIDWQAPPCCTPCEQRPSYPCESSDDDKDFQPKIGTNWNPPPYGGEPKTPWSLGLQRLPEKIYNPLCNKQYESTPYEWRMYGQHGFLSSLEICGMDNKKCFAGEHTYEYAFNLCACQGCEEKPPAHCPTCTEGKSCAAQGHESYDYEKHHRVDKNVCSKLNAETGDGASRTLKGMFSGEEDQ